MTRRLVLCLLFVWATVAVAQAPATFTIGGKVVDGFGDGLPGVTIRAAASTPFVVTNTDPQLYTGIVLVPATVPGTAGSVLGVHATVHVSYAQDVSHLGITLLHPDGTSADLKFYGSGSGGEFRASYPEGVAPDGDLSVFNGKPAGGTWQLRIESNDPVFPLYIRPRLFTLQVDAGSAGQTLTVADGTYAIPDLPAASYTVTPWTGGIGFPPLTRSGTVGPACRPADFTGGVEVPTMLSPADGDRWLMGEAREINWAGIGTNVQLELSRDGGGSWETLFASTAADGRESWLVTGPPTDQALIRVTSTTNPAATATSGVFTIAGHTIAGSVTAGAAGVAGVTVRAVGGDPAATHETTTAADGTYALTDVPPGRYDVTPTKPACVMSPASQTVTVGPDATANFSATLYSLEVTAPAAGATWHVGEAANITWNTNIAGGTVDIELSRDAGTTWETLVDDSDNDGSEAWTVTEPVAAQARFRITPSLHPTAVGTSGDFVTAFYTIKGTVTRGGRGVAGVTVDANTATEVEHSTSPAFTIPGDGAVESTLNVADMGALSAVHVRVRFNYCDYEGLVVTLIHPDGTEVVLHRYEGGSGYADWTYPDSRTPRQSLNSLVGKSGSGTWKLRVSSQYCADGVLNGWRLRLEGKGKVATTTTAANGTYTLEVQRPAAYTVVPGKAGLGFNPFSRDVTVGPDATGVDFAAAARAITVWAPNGGQRWRIGEARQITWTANFPCSNMRVDLSRDSGATWEPLFENTPHDGSETWTVAGPTTNHARVRVSSLTDPVSDVSNADFLIDAYTISGTVTQNGAGLPGVTVTAAAKGASARAALSTATRVPGNGEGVVPTGVLEVPLAISGVREVAGVHVAVSATHCDVDYLEFSLVHPDGTTVLLLPVWEASDVNDDDRNVVTVFPDQTPSAEDLAALNGKPGDGTWKLRVVNSACHPGLVRSCALTVDGEVTRATATTGADGTYALAGLCAGTYAVRPEMGGATFRPFSRNLVLGPSRTGVDFAAVAPALTVAGPNGGESWGLGETGAITWASSLNGDVKIELSRDGGSQWETLFATTPNDGAETWPLVAGPATDTARVRITSVQYPNVSDASDANFAISGFGISGTVLEGTAGVPGVTMTATGPYQARHTTSPGVEIPPGDWFRGRARVIESPLVVNEDGLIGAAHVTVNLRHCGGSKLTVSLIHPDGTEVVLSDEDYGFEDPITFPDDEDPDEDLDALAGKPMAGTWKLRIKNWGCPPGILRSWGLHFERALQTTTGADGTYAFAGLDPGNWMVSAVKDGCRMAPARWSVTVGPSQTGVDFHVVDLALTAPNGGEALAVGYPVRITWRSTGIIGPVDILLSRDGGASYTTLIAGTANDGSEEWTVTGPVTEQARFAVRGALPMFAEDTSDGNVIFAAPDNLAFMAQPTDAPRGVAIGPAVQVAVQDAAGRNLTNATPSITVALGVNPTAALLGGTRTVAAVHGVATFANLTVSKAGAGYTLAATSPGLTPDESAPFTVFGPPTQLAFTAQPTDTAAGATMAPVQVEVRDALGLKVSTPGLAVSLSIYTNPAGARLLGSMPVTTVNGVATFSDLRVDKPGAGLVLRAIASRVTGADSGAFTITSE